jgi:hypothetical protein
MFYFQGASSFFLFFDSSFQVPRRPHICITRRKARMITMLLGVAASFKVISFSRPDLTLSRFLILSLFVLSFFFVLTVVSCSSGDSRAVG